MSCAHFKPIVSKSCKFKRVIWKLDKSQTHLTSKSYCTKETVRNLDKGKDLSIRVDKERYLTKSVTNLLNLELVKLTQDAVAEKKEDSMHFYTGIQKRGTGSRMIKNNNLEPATSREYFSKTKPDKDQEAEISVYHIKKDKKLVDNNGDECLNVKEYSTIDDEPTFVDKIMMALGFKFTMIQSPAIDASNYDTVSHTNTPLLFGDQKDLEILSTVSFSHNESLRQNLKSNQEAGFGVNVLQCTDNDFESLINDSKATIVMFYASWCGNCATIKPAFSKLATTLKSEGIGKAIAIDAAINPRTADFAHVEIIPTFKLYKSGKEIAVYNGDRSFEDFLNFVKKN